jgi:hypothetical protein
LLVGWDCGCQHIKKYHGANLVLEDLTLEIRQGERVGLAEAEQQLAEIDALFQVPNCTDDIVKYNQTVAEWEF